MDDQLENKAQEAADNMEQAANESWQSIEFAANQGATPPPYTQAQQPPQYYQPPQQTQYAPNDPNRWTGDLYTPEAPQPPQGYPQHAPSGYIDSQRVSYAAPPPPPAQKEKEKFPVWAIVLIVLLVLLICIACTILPFAFIGKLITEYPGL